MTPASPVASPVRPLRTRPHRVATPRFCSLGRRWGMSFWALAVVAIAGVVATPVVVVLSSIFADSTAIWSHLASTVLPRYLINSVLLMLGVGAGVLGLGVSTAWLVTVCRFPGRRWLEWGLLLPLAAPGYLLAYAYTDFLDYSGPVQSGLRSLFGWETMADYWFPEVRSLGGAIALLSLTLYPYVYLLARVAFLEQSERTLEASRGLGCSPWRSFFQVALPLARPSIAAGVALALMETLNDFGTVQYFGVDTFTTGIYRTWFGMGERVAATQLAAVLLLVIFGLIGVEQASRQRARYYRCGVKDRSQTGYRLHGGRAIAAMVACGLPIGLGLLVPGAWLSWLAYTHASETFDAEFWALSANSLGLAIATVIVGLVCALVLAYGLRLQQGRSAGRTWLRPGPWMRWGARLASMGYAVPGAVIAVGLLIPLGRLDQGLNAGMQYLWGRWASPSSEGSPGLLLSGTAIALVLAYLVRFLAVALNTVESSLQAIKPNLDDAARGLGQSPLRTLWTIHLPLMSSGLLTAVMLLFVDVMKELPATLVMRPFNFDTLAVRVYQYASDERLAVAAGPAIAILAVGLVPVIALSYQIARDSAVRRWD